MSIEMQWPRRAETGAAGCGFVLAGALLRLQCLGEKKFVEMLRYIHRNPVKRGLLARPEDWPWSSFRHYAMGETGMVEIESQRTARKREWAWCPPDSEGTLAAEKPRPSGAWTGHPRE